MLKLAIVLSLAVLASAKPHLRSKISFADGKIIGGVVATPRKYFYSTFKC
jgi:hypothetical protein